MTFRKPRKCSFDFLFTTFNYSSKLNIYETWQILMYIICVTKISHIFPFLMKFWRKIGPSSSKFWLEEGFQSHLHIRTRLYLALVSPGPSLVFAHKLPTRFTVLFPVKHNACSPFMQIMATDHMLYAIIDVSESFRAVRVWNRGPQTVCHHVSHPIS